MNRLAGGQSGVMWRDGTRKPSYQAFREAVELVQSGDIDCSTVPGAGGPIPEATAGSRRSRLTNCLHTTGFCGSRSSHEPASRGPIVA